MTLIAYQTQRHEDLRDTVSKIVQEQNDAILSNFLVQTMAATDTTHKWVDKKLKGQRDVLNGSINSSITTVTITNGAYKRIVEGKSYMKVDSEIMSITYQTTNTLTVGRGALGTTAATHSDGADAFFFIMYEEGADNSDDHSQTGSKITNVTKIFRRELKLSGTSQAVKSVGNDNAWSNQAEELMKELLQELRIMFCQSNVKYTDGDESLRAFAGLPYYVTNVVPQGGNLISTAMFDSAIETLLDNGANPNDIVILAPTRQIKYINDHKVARVVGGGMSQDDKTLRQNVDMYEFSDVVAKIIRVPELAKNELYIGEKSKAKIVPLQNRSFRIEDIGKVGDSVQKLLVGEYTCEVMNGADAWVRFTGLGV